jgi:uncharacterized membrane protein
MSEGPGAFPDPWQGREPDRPPPQPPPAETPLSPRRGRRQAVAVPQTLDVDISGRPATEEFVPGRLVRGRGRQPPLQPPSPVHAILAYAVVSLALLHLFALGFLWPRGTAPVAPGTSAAGLGVTYTKAEVRQITTTSCPGTTDTRLPNGSIPAVTTCDYAAVTLNSGADAGKTVTVSIPPGVARSGLRAGNDVQIVHYPPAEGAPGTYAFSDFTREIPLALLAVVFAALVILVARLRGIVALAGLGLAFATIGLFVLPALHRGENPALVSAVGAGAIMIVILYATHGFSTKTTTALLGTLAGIWTTAGLATWVTTAAHLNGLGNEENETLSRLTNGLDLRGLILAGIVLAGLGVLNDVTITQASAVWELRQHAPHLGIRGLFSSGMRIGRDHLASTIYTIAFAYAGVALPTLLLVSIYGTPIRELLNSSQIAEEVARTLAASIGLALAIPLTTIIAAALAARSRPDSDVAAAPGPHGHAHVH